MRELPPAEAADVVEESSTIAFVPNSLVVVHHPQRWRAESGPYITHLVLLLNYLCSIQLIMKYFSLSCSLSVEK
jgi:hypothetical protein